MSSVNTQIAKAALMRAKKEIMSRLASKALQIGSRIAEQALVEKGFSGFTGNAQTSYTAMVFNEGKVSTYSTGSHQKHPIRSKVDLGEIAYLEEPYEGSPRTVIGQVDVEDDFASETIAQIRKQPLKEKGVTMRLAVGVEYNDYIGKPIDNMHAHARIIQSEDFK